MKSLHYQYLSWAEKQTLASSMKISFKRSVNLDVQVVLQPGRYSKYLELRLLDIKKKGWCHKKASKPDIWEPQQIQVCFQVLSEMALLNHLEVSQDSL